MFELALPVFAHDGVTPTGTIWGDTVGLNLYGNTLVYGAVTATSFASIGGAQLKLPIGTGINGQVLVTDGAGNASWSNTAEVNATNGGISQINGLNAASQAITGSGGITVTPSGSTHTVSSSGNLSNWNTIATSTKQDASANLAAWSGIDVSAKANTAHTQLGSTITSPVDQAYYADQATIAGTAVTAVSANSATLADYATIAGRITGILTNSISGNAATATTATNAILAQDGYGVASTNWVLQAIKGIGRFSYFSGITNNTGSFAESGQPTRTNSYQAFTSVPSITTTQTFTSLIVGAYIRNNVSTQAVTRILAGPCSVVSYAYRTGSGTISMHYEIYSLDVGTGILTELGSSSAQTVTGSSSSIQTLHFSISIPITSVFTNDTRIVVACKLDSNGNPGSTVSFVNGGLYDAYVSFIQALSDISISGNQISGAVAEAAHATYATSVTNTLTLGAGITNSPTTYNGSVAKTIAVDLGTNATQAAFGNHSHTGVYEPTSNIIRTNFTHNFGSINPGVIRNTNVTVTGAALGDIVSFAHTAANIRTWRLDGCVTAPNTVTLDFYNGDVSAHTLDGTTKILIFK